MSSSDPTSNLESLNISSEPMDVPAVVGEASQRSSRSASSTPRRARSKTTQGGGSGRKPVSTIMKALPRASQSRGPLVLRLLVLNPMHQVMSWRGCLIKNSRQVLILSMKLRLHHMILLTMMRSLSAHHHQIMMTCTKQNLELTLLHIKLSMGLTLMMRLMINLPSQV